jgi:hypothetical protein
MKSERSYLVVGVLLVALATSIAMCNSVRAANPVISISPLSITVTQGQFFTVDVVLDYSVNIYAFQFSVSFDNTKLLATAIDYDGYLNEPTTELANIINNPAGYVSYSRISHLPALPTTKGLPAPLATIHFKALATGSSNLHLYDTIINDNNGFELDHTTSDGQVTIESPVGPVGGIWETVDMFKLLTPWIGLVAAVAASGALFGLFKKRIKREIN